MTAPARCRSRDSLLLVLLLAASLSAQSDEAPTPPAQEPQAEPPKTAALPVTPAVVESVAGSTLHSDPAPLTPSVRVSLAPDDTIVVLGDGLAEQLRSHGTLETRLLAAHPWHRLRLRNLGFAGDSSTADSWPLNVRGLEQHLDRIGADVVFLCFGLHASLDGISEDGLDRLEDDYRELLAHLRSLPASNPRPAVNAKDEPQTLRVVIVSPTAHERLAPSLPAPAERNAALKAYTDRLRRIASESKTPFVDLFTPSLKAMRAATALAKQQTSEEQKTEAESAVTPPASSRLTTNGVRLSPLGTWLASGWIVEQTLPTSTEWKVNIDAKQKTTQAVGATIATLRSSAAGVTFKLTAQTLPPPPVPKTAPEGLTAPVRLSVQNLPAGHYRLTVDDHEIVTGSSADWQQGVALSGLPCQTQSERLREAVIRKSTLFHDRWVAAASDATERQMAFPPEGITFPLHMMDFDQALTAAENDIRSLLRPTPEETWTLERLPAP